jgi:vancomycin resistance protein YoaR
MRENMKNEHYWVTGALRLLILQLILSLIGVFLGFTWSVYDNNNKWEKVFYPGVKVANIDLSGVTKEEGINIIKLKYIDLLLNKKITIKTRDKSYILESSKLITGYDLDNVINKAYNLGKDLGFYSKNRFIKQGALEQHAISFNYNNDYIKEFVGNLEKDVNNEPTDASIQSNLNGELHINSDTKGQKLEVERLENLIKESVIDGSSDDTTIEAPIKQTVAAITSDKLTSIDTKIAGYKTSFVTSSDKRSNNIELSTKLINGKILMPEEVFSFNQSVGERTRERGFQEAPVIIGNALESGIGGGICQVSSTLYNTALRAGIKDFERAHHSIPSSYVGLGLDATVDWGNIDFKFKNTFKYPIFIEAYTENKKLYINLYSNSSLNNRRYEIINDVYQTDQSKTQTITDTSLPIGQTMVAQTGRNGYKVKVIRSTYEGEKIVETEVISNDYYIPKSNIIRIGNKVNS